MKKLLFVLLGLLLAIAVFGAGQQESEEEKVFEIIFPSHDNLGSTQANAQQMFADLMNERSEGRVNVKVFPAGQMGGMQENTESVQLGTAQMTSTDPGNIGARVPHFTPMALPYMFDDWDHVGRVVDGKAGDMLNDVLIEKEGLRILGWMYVGFRDMITIEPPIRSLEDFRGVKFRSPGIPVYVKMFEALGATPTPVPWPEVYTALQNKVVDGAETTAEGMVNSRFYEMCNYVTLTGHINSQSMIVMNEDFYQSLPKDLQALVHEVMDEVLAYERAAILESNNNAYAELEKQGIEIYEIDKEPLRTAVASVWDELAGSAESKQIIEMIDSVR